MNAALTGAAFPVENPGGSAAQRSLQLALTPRRKLLLTLYAAAIVLNIAAQNYWLGIPAFLATLWFLVRDESPELRRRLGVLLGCVAILALADINTGLSNANFLRVGIPFALVVFLPGVILARLDPGVIRTRLWPRRLRRLGFLLVGESLHAPPLVSSRRVRSPTGDAPFRGNQQCRHLG